MKTFFFFILLILAFFLCLFIKENKDYKKDYSISTLNQVFNIIQIKQNEITYSTENKKVIFFDLNERKNKSIIENISNSIFGTLCMVSNDLLLIPGKIKIL